jgi:hypothetical protein
MLRNKPSEPKPGSFLRARTEATSPNQIEILLDSRLGISLLPHHSVAIATVNLVISCLHLMHKFPIALELLEA